MSTNHHSSYALLSVADKTGLILLAQCFVQHDIHLLATGKTFAILKEANIPVTAISDFTDFNEILDGRVKTLHPKIFAGLLARKNLDDEIMNQQSFPFIDYVVVNLYPFTTITSQPHTFEQAIENIDIGGVSLIRAAAKNYARVSVLTNPNDYDDFCLELANGISNKTKFNLAKKAFLHTADYDRHIANYLMQLESSPEKIASPLEQDQRFPLTNGNGDFQGEKCNSSLESQVRIDFARTENNQGSSDRVFQRELLDQDKFSLHLNKIHTLRYGENPNQDAYVYQANTQAQGLLAANILQGKTLSYNNYVDADCALQCVAQLAKPACVIVKHANPCGASVSNSTLNAYQKAYQADPISAFGGIIAFNDLVDEKLANAILTTQFVELIIAPAFTKTSLEIFATKPNVRIIEIDFTGVQHTEIFSIRSILGGYLIQTNNDLTNYENWQIVTDKKPTENEIPDFQFAFTMVKWVKSNAIVVTAQQQTLGIGAGQTNRVGSVQIAMQQAQRFPELIPEAILASDAFFPFKDSIDLAADYGITKIIQPGGSMRDQEVIDRANELGITMIFTHQRYFRH